MEKPSAILLIDPQDKKKVLIQLLLLNKDLFSKVFIVMLGYPSDRNIYLREDNIYEIGIPLSRDLEIRNLSSTDREALSESLAEILSFENIQNGNCPWLFTIDARNHFIVTHLLNKFKANVVTYVERLSWEYHNVTSSTNLSIFHSYLYQNLAVSKTDGLLSSEEEQMFLQSKYVLTHQTSLKVFIEKNYKKKTILIVERKFEEWINLVIAGNKTKASLKQLEIEKDRPPDLDKYVLLDLSTTKPELKVLLFQFSNILLQKYIGLKVAIFGIEDLLDLDLVESQFLHHFIFLGKTFRPSFKMLFRKPLLLVNLSEKRIIEQIYSDTKLLNETHILTYEFTLSELAINVIHLPESFLDISYEMRIKHLLEIWDSLGNKERKLKL